MKDLFLGECLRFRNAALIFAGVHLLLQLFVGRMVDLPQGRWELHILLLAAYMLAALAFALYQFGSYRQPSRWVWLLHRPLPPRAIFAALGGAACTLILFAVGLPALLAVASADLLSARTVDARHYLMVLHLVVLTISAWLAGSYVILNRSRSAAVILLVPFLLLGHLASAVTMLLPAALCLALLAFTASGTFKPDRMAPPSGTAMLAATAAPLLLGFYLAMLWGGSLLFQNVQILTVTHPLNIPVPPAGGFTESTRAGGRDLLLAGLAYASDPRAAQWRRQVALLEIDNFEPAGKQFPVRHQASNLDTLQWTDSTRNIEWTFSHDSMRFDGRDVFTSQGRGTLGLGGIGDLRPFPAVPVLAGDGYIVTPQQLYAFDKDSGSVRPMIALRAPETLARTPRLANGRLYVITSHRLIAYHRPPEGDTTMLKQAFSMPLPGPFSDLDRIDIAGLMDGALVSFSFGRDMMNGAAGSAQTIMLAGAGAGGAKVVAIRPLAHDFPALFEHRAWWISPALHAMHALPDALLDQGCILDRGKTNAANRLWYPRPASVWAAAILASLASAVGAWFWMRGAAIPRRRKAGWIASCLLFGPPALPCLMVLQARPPLPRAGQPPADSQQAAAMAA